MAVEKNVTVVEGLSVAAKCAEVMIDEVGDCAKTMMPISEEFQNCAFDCACLLSSKSQPCSREYSCFQ